MFENCTVGNCTNVHCVYITVLCHMVSGLILTTSILDNLERTPQIYSDLLAQHIHFLNIYPPNHWHYPFFFPHRLLKICIIGPTHHHPQPTNIITSRAQLVNSFEKRFWFQEHISFALCNFDTFSSGYRLWDLLAGICFSWLLGWLVWRAGPGGHSKLWPPCSGARW